MILHQLLKYIEEGSSGGMASPGAMEIGRYQVVGHQVVSQLTEHYFLHYFDTKFWIQTGLYEAHWPDCDCVSGFCRGMTWLVFRVDGNVLVVMD